MGVRHFAGISAGTWISESSNCLQQSMLEMEAGVGIERFSPRGLISLTQELPYNTGVQLPNYACTELLTNLLALLLALPGAGRCSAASIEFIRVTEMMAPLSIVPGPDCFDFHRGAGGRRPSFSTLMLFK